MSAYYKTCSNCGSNLDPGEKCDCDSPSYKEPEESQNIILSEVSITDEDSGQ